MMKHFAPLAALLALLLVLTACGAADSQSPEDTAPAKESTATLEELCSSDYQSYIIETITMQMGNRMDKTPDVVYFPIADNAPLTDYAAIDETTDFTVDGDGNIVVLFPAGTVTDEAHGEQSFRIPRP